MLMLGSTEDNGP